MIEVQLLVGSAPDCTDWDDDDVTSLAVAINAGKGFVCNLNNMQSRAGWLPAAAAVSTTSTIFPSPPLQVLSSLRLDLPT